MKSKTESCPAHLVHAAMEIRNGSAAPTRPNTIRPQVANLPHSCEPHVAHGRLAGLTSWLITRMGALAGLMLCAGTMPLTGQTIDLNVKQVQALVDGSPTAKATGTGGGKTVQVNYTDPAASLDISITVTVPSGELPYSKHDIVRDPLLGDNFAFDSPVQFQISAQGKTPANSNSPAAVVMGYQTSSNDTPASGNFCVLSWSNAGAPPASTPCPLKHLEIAQPGQLGVPADGPAMLWLPLTFILYYPFGGGIFHANIYFDAGKPDSIKVAPNDCAASPGVRQGSLARISGGAQGDVRPKGQNCYASKIQAVQVAYDPLRDPRDSAYPLVLGKLTAVRVVILSGGTNDVPSLSGGGSPRITGTISSPDHPKDAPIHADNEKEVVARVKVQDPPDTNDSLNFTLPSAWIDSIPSCEVALLLTRRCLKVDLDIRLDNNPIDQEQVTLWFDRPGKWNDTLRIGYFSLCNANQSPPVCPQDPSLAAGPFMATQYPLKSDGVVYEKVLPDQPYKGDFIGDNGQVNVIAGYQLINALGLIYQAVNLGGVINIGPIDQLVGWAPFGEGLEDFLFVSKPNSGLGRVWLISNNDRYDNPQENLAFELGHAVAHNLGLAEKTSGKPIGNYSPVLRSSTEDSHSLTSAPRGGYSSTVEYDALLDANEINPGPVRPKTPADRSGPKDEATSVPSAKVARPKGDGQPVEYLLISGEVSPDGTLSTLDAGFRVTSTRPGPVSNPDGSHCIRFDGDANNDFCFTPYYLDPDNPGSEGGFGVAAPFPSGASSIALVYRDPAAGDRTLTSLTASAAPPTLTILSPAPGTSWNGKQTIQWSATDASGTPLTYLVRYSQDNGATWIPLSLPLTDTQFDVNSGDLIGSTVWFQVLATNGLQTASAMVGPLTAIQNFQMQASTAEVDFGSVPPGREVLQTVTISNTGDAPFRVSPQLSGDPAFQLPYPTPMIWPGKTQDVTIRFVANLSTTGMGTLTLATPDATQTPITISLKAAVGATGGSGPTITVSPASLSFGTVAAGQPATTMKLTISNTGQADLHVQSIAVSGDASFSLVSPPATPLAIAAGKSVDVNVKFAPTTAGSPSATVVVASDDAKNSSLKVPLTGTATAGSGGGGGTITGITLEGGYWDGANFSQLSNRTASSGQTCGANSSTWTLGVTLPGSTDIRNKADRSVSLQPGAYDLYFTRGLNSYPYLRVIVCWADGREPDRTVFQAGDFATQSQFNRISGSTNLMLGSTGITNASLVPHDGLTPDGSPNDVLSLNIMGSAGGGGGGGGTSGCLPAPANLVSWLAGDGNTNDLTGSNKGTAVGGTTYAAGEVGQAFQFDGSTGYVTLGNPSNLQLTSAMTVEAWINPKSAPATDNMQAILTKWGQVFNVQPDSDAYGLWFRNDATAGLSLFASIHPSGLIEPHVVAGKIPLNTWTHVAMTYDASSGNLVAYVNGQAVGLVSASGPIVTSTRNVFIGREDSTAPRPFNGLIDEVSVYNRALSAAEIQAIYAAGSAGKCKPGSTGGSSPVMTVSTSALNFGAVTAGQPATTMKFTISNTGAADLHVQSIKLSGDASYTLVQPPAAPLTIAPGKSVDVTVQFAPTSAGTPAATVVIASDDSNNSPWTVNLTGTVTAGSGGGGGTITGITLEGGYWDGANFSQLTNRTASSGQTCGANSSTWTLGVTLPGSTDLRNKADRSVSLSPGAYYLYFTRGLNSYPYLRVIVCWADGREPDKTVFQAGDFATQSQFNRISGSTNLMLGSTGITNASLVPHDGLTPDGSPNDVLSLNIMGSAGGGGSPSLSATPATVDLGSTAVNTVSASKDITIRNTGAAAATVSLTVTGPFTVSAASTQIAAGASATVQVKFAPVTATPAQQSGTLTVSAAGASPVTVNLSGTVSSGAPVMTVSSKTLSFGTVPPGAPPVTMSVTVGNSGTADLHVQTVKLSGDASFSLAPVPAVPITINPGKTASITVQFTPKAVGTAAGSLVVTSDDPNPATSAATIAVSASVGAPVMSISVKTLTLGPVTIGQPPATAKVTISNTGTADLHVKSAAVTGDTSFSLVPAAFVPFTVSAGQSASISLQYAPATTNAALGFLTITSDDPNPSNNPWTIGLSGTATGGGNAPVVSVSPSSLNFGSVTVGQTADQKVTLSNTGTASLSISSITSSQASFTLVQPPSAVSAGKSADVTVRFAPSTAGPVSGTITVATTELGNLPAIAVSGTGAAGQACQSPADLVSWWRAENNANDSAGGNNGTLTGGVSFAAGEVGQAFQFDGNTGYVSVGNPASLRLSAAITIEGWINPKTSPSNTNMAAVLTKWGQQFNPTPDADSYGLWLRGTGSTPTMFAGIHISGTTEPNVQGGAVPLNTWTHVAMTFDSTSGQLALYVNGQSVASEIISGAAINATSRNVLIGREDSSSPRPFNGLIDELAVYSRALSASEIQAIFNAGSLGKCH